jgi:hypothetical protein
MEATDIIGPSILDKLRALKSEIFDADGTPVELVELTGFQASALWVSLSEAEKSGHLIDAYSLLILHGAVGPSGAPLFASLDLVKRLPARLIVPMGEIMLRLCDMGIDSGKADAPDEN